MLFFKTESLHFPYFGVFERGGNENQNVNYEHKFEGGKKALFYQALESVACLPSIFSVDANIDCLK